MVCLKVPEPHTCVLWGTQFVTLSFAHPTPEDRKVLAFARDIRIGLLPVTVVVQPEWFTPYEVAVTQAAEMETLLVHLAPGHLCLPPDTPRNDRVSVPWSSLPPLYLVHPLILSPLLAPATAWYMMHAKSDAMGMT